MRPISPRASRIRRAGRFLAIAVALCSGVGLLAQIPGRNVNMVAGLEWPGGDPFLQRQNEPSLAASTRNPLHLVAGSNDYRTVDVPGLPDGSETGDAWVSIYKSFDGGERWSSTLMPGYPQDHSAAGLASPIKGYQAAADPVVRSGTHGLVYYNGLVFDRGENGRSGIFLARFIDKNNQEAGDPIEYLGTSMVASSTGAVFLDKPWMVVDVPRGNSGFCAVGVAPTAADDDDDDHGRRGKVKRNGHRRRGRGDDRRRGNQPPDDGYQYVPAGAIYVAYTAITGEGPSIQAQIFVKRSMDCGVTWSQAMRVSSTADAINQGATLAVSPTSGDLFVAWRRFSTTSVVTADAVMVARLKINGNSFDAPGKARGLRRTHHDDDAEDRIFEHRKKRARVSVAAEVSQIDQGTGPFRFRTNAYPAMAIDGTGRAYVAWSERGFATLNPDPVDGDARILVASTTNGKDFATAVVADEQQQLGHQLMPSLAFAGGKLMLVYYDLRETKAQLFGRFIDDALSTNGKRHTIDIRAALGSPGAVPAFAPSVRVSDYLMGFRNSTSLLEALQVNPPNLPMFRLGTVPFIGDYIDVAPSPAFVPAANGEWIYNTASNGQMPTFHAVWTDNRDVRPPLDGNWANYTPPTINGQLPGTSLFDPTQQVAVCYAGNAGSRNQNIYTARIGGGLLVGAPGNAKQLSPTVQRGFVVFAQNQTTTTRTFRMTLLAQPPGGRASFEQFPLPPYTASSPPPLTTIDVRVPARSTASRTVYATSSDPKAQLSISVTEVGAVGGATVPGGLAGRAVINPDIENPDIENPDIENPDIENPDIENAEVYNPDIENPDIENPDIENPDIENPDIENPDIENVRVANPDIENIGVGNPDIENPDIENPDIENPDIENPDIENGAIADVTWTVSNIGNTTAAFNVNLFLAAAGVPSGINTQLVVYKVYKTPVLAPNGCDLRTETRNVILYNVPNPNFVTPGQGLPDQNDPADTNATLWLNPGEVGRVTLRLFDEDTSNNITVTNLDGSTASIDPGFNPETAVTAAISAQGVDILDPPGATEPPAVTTTGTNLFYLQQPTSALPGALLSPPVRVRIWDNTGAPLPGVTVSIALENPPVGVLLSGTTTAVADGDGIAEFTALAVNLPATGLRLRATATSPGSVAAGTSAPFDVAIAGGPVSLWHADGTALDSVGSNHGTLQGGASYGPGRIGPAFSFSNPLPAGTADQYVLVPDDPSLRITNQMTMSAWIYPTGPGTGPAPFGVGEGGVIVNKEYAYEMARFADGSIRWAFGNGVDTFAPLGYWIDSGGTAPLNAWTHVAVTYDNGTVTTYINGASVGSITPPAIVLGAGTHTLRIGGREYEPGGANFDGRIDEVGIQDRALTAAEALALYNGALFQVTAGVSIGSVNAIFDGSAKSVSVTTTPLGVPVTVLYNTSLTAPSAIGAYFVQAIASQNGDAGAASVTHKIASTLPAGGNGGGPYPASGALGCGPGVFATGVRPSTVPYYGLLGHQLLCGDGNHPARVSGQVPTGWGHTVYTEADAVCGPGEVMVGLHGQTDAPFGFTVVQNIGPRCQPAIGGTVTDVPAIGANYSGDGFSLTCNPGQAVTGVVGGIGEVVDSIALACAALPPPPATITSVSPAAQVAGSQMLTINGVSLPATGETDVLFNQGGSDVTAQYLWGASPTRVIARLPFGLLTPGIPTTVRLKNPGNTITTNAFPVTISDTPGTPVLTSLLNQCSGGTAITAVLPGGPFAFEGEGIDTSGTTAVWTPITAIGTVITQSGTTSTGGPTGRLCSYFPGGAPAGLTSGTWSLQLRTTVGAFTSADSNAIAVTVP